MREKLTMADTEKTFKKFQGKTVKMVDGVRIVPRSRMNRLSNSDLPFI